VVWMGAIRAYAFAGPLKVTQRPQPGGRADLRENPRRPLTFTLSMTDSKANVVRRSRLIVVGAWVCGIASAGGMVAMILIAIDKVTTGHGLDTFRTKWLIEDSWIGFLVFVAATIVTGLVAAVFGWHQRRKERREVQQLHARYTGEHHG
jgi:hypothetical protein